MQTLKRTIAIIWLTLFGLYMTAAFFDNYFDGHWPLRVHAGSIFWPAKWKMFTRANPFQEEVIFEGKFQGHWEKLPMEKWHPSPYESGDRWERPVVYRNRSRQIPFLVAACQKSHATDVRMVRLRWPKKTPKGEIPVETRKIISGWDCSKEPPKPRGKKV